MTAAARPDPTARLSPRQWQIVRACHYGLTTKEIAQKLGIKPSSVRTHLEAIRRKLGVHTCTQALALLSRQGRLPDFPPPPDAPTSSTPPWQSAYLEAFDRHLKGDRTARAAMTHALHGMRNHQHLPPTPARHPTDPISHILHTLATKR